MSSVETTLTGSDVHRVIRFMNAAPLSVSVESEDAIAHDVERYCAFRQDAYHEAEKSRDATLTHLQRARDARLKLLDGIDKYVSSFTPNSL
jgi:hypothetical protein